ncbi:MAG: uroporphyrinogen-III C-methyltransferase [Schwartzia sp.]|nr:uroporphyrinogen-III C-methyltransferase [Schwartzia sp. (in: firmicutes)]
MKSDSHRIGKVFLVGAGPGDYRLITWKGIECLRAADIIVYDHLADSRILAWGREDAERIYVGKEAANHTMRQGDISRLLVDKAKEGKIVTRLKGGDPFVFGRGGEEALLLRENNVPFEIVPGVTSAIAVPAYAGIPVTHRAVATSFAVITGHEDPTKPESQINWKNLATGIDTLVFLMGVANIREISRKLIENGRPADMPAAVIRWGTKPEQRTLVTTLERAADDVAKNDLKPPAIFIVGEVVKLRDEISWFDDKSIFPLFGKTVLVTRSRSQISKVTRRLEDLGANVIELPAIKISDPADNFEAIDAAISLLASYDWIIFTSVNGVTRFFNRLFAQSKDARDLTRAHIAAIGSATAAKLKEYGILTDIVPEEYKAEAMVKALKGEVAPGERVLIPRAAEAREVLPESLREHGAIVDVAPVYETLPSGVDAGDVVRSLKEGKIDFATFASSSTVKNLVKMIGDAALLKNTKTVAIGPITAKTCEDEGLNVAAVAKEYTINGLVEAVIEEASK